MKKYPMLMLSLFSLFTMFGCEKDYDLLTDYVCMSCGEKQSKTYELRIGNQVTYTESGSNEELKTNPDGLLFLKGADTTTIKKEDLVADLNLTLTGTATLIETDGTEEVEVTREITTSTKTDKNGKFFFTIIHTTAAGKIISEVKNLNLEIKSQIGTATLAHDINFDGTSAWSTAMGYLGAYSTYDISHGEYPCSSDKCTYIDLGGDLTLKRK